MPLAQLTKTIRAPFNQGVKGLYAQLVTWLSAQTNIVIQDMDWFRPQSTYAGDENRVRIAYTQATPPAIGGAWIAKLYQDSTSGVTAQTAFNLEFAGGLQAVPFFVIDVTEHERTRTGPNSLLVVCMVTGAAPLGMVGHDRLAFIGAPDANVAAGATGTFTFWDATGRQVGTGLTVRNVGPVQWDQDQRNYVVVDDVTGEFIGLPSCCGAAIPVPIATTSTPYPCPAYLSGQTMPVMP